MANINIFILYRVSNQTVNLSLLCSDDFSFLMSLHNQETTPTNVLILSLTNHFFSEISIVTVHETGLRTSNNGVGIVDNPIPGTL